MRENRAWTGQMTQEGGGSGKPAAAPSHAAPELAPEVQTVEGRVIAQREQTAELLEEAARLKARAEQAKREADALLQSTR